MAFKRRKSDVDSVNQKNVEVNIVFVEKKSPLLSFGC